MGPGNAAGRGGRRTGAAVLGSAALAAVAALALPGTARAAEAAAGHGAALSPAWGLPFAGVLLSIALLPVLAGGFWHHHYRKVALAWALAFLVPYAAAFGVGAAADEVAHTFLLEYLPFIALLLALYTTGGGVLVRGGIVGTPEVNTAILAFGTAIASLMGTTGASMLLVRPLLRANAARRRRTHTLVFFVFLVSNIGGSLTPLGDPPLYLGFLAGVSFGWPAANLFGEFLFLSLALLAIYYALDRLAWRHDRDFCLRAAADEPRGPIRVEGWGNVALIGVVVAGVLMQGVWRPGDAVILGQTLGIERVAAVFLFVGVAVASMQFTPKGPRAENEFGWGAMIEVAALFAAIFVTMAPVLAILRAGEAGAAAPLVALVTGADGGPIPWAYFWLTGGLSSFLDNAPTYLVFFNLAGGDPQRLMGEGALTLAAISCGAVFMGANSYIGNAPNLMVKAIAEERGFAMPSFFGYCGWALAFLVPLFVAMTFLFFR